MQTEEGNDLKFTSRGKRRLQFFRILPCAIFFFSGLLLKAQSEPFPFHQLIQKLDGIKTLRADVTIFTSGKTMGKDSEIFKSSGKLYAVVPNQLRMDMEIRKGLLGTKNQGTPISTTLLYNGKTLWLTARRKSNWLPAITLDVSKLENEAPELFSQNRMAWLNNPAFDLFELDPDRLKFLGTERLPSGKTYRVEGPVKKEFAKFFGTRAFAFEKSSAPSQIKLWVGMENGITYQAVMLDPQEKILGRMKLTHVALNQPLEESRFQGSFPKNLTPIDITPMFEKILSEKSSKQSLPDQEKKP